MLLSLVVVGSFLANLPSSSATPYNPPQYCRRDACYSQAWSSQSHCSSYLQKTVTAAPQTRTITFTVSSTVALTESATALSLTTSTRLTTETDVTTTTRTEVDSETTTTSTTQTIVTTSIVSESTTATAATVTIGGQARRKLRDVREKPNRRSPAAPATTTAKKQAPRPPPCPEACPNTSSFISACSCLGVQPKTITAPGPTTTILRTVSAIGTQTNQVTSTVLSTVSTDATARVSSTATEVETTSVTSTSTDLEIALSTTTETTTIVATTVTPTCSLSSTPTTLTQNGKFDTNYESSTSDPPWTLAGSAQFLNLAQNAQSPPILVSIPLSSSQPGGSVSQVITGYQSGQTYTLSTFFRPFSLSPNPTDTSVQQSCTFNVAWGSTNLFTRQYTSQNGTQSGYSYVQFNRVAAPSGTSAPLTISYTCPGGYIGSGFGNFYIDTVSITGNTVICTPQ